MAPALTAEPLSPKEKLTSTASPATGTRQSVRKLESLPSSGGGGSGNDSAKKPTVATIAPAAVATVTGAVETAAAAVVPPTTTSTRVTRSKDAAQRISSPVVQVPPTNKRKTNNNTHNNNNNNNSCSSSNSRVNEVKPSNDQMGLSAAATHTSTDGSAASTSGSAASSEATASTPDAAVNAVVAAEHNNNCKDNSTAELLANLTNEFEEAITAEICLRKTLPEVSLSKEQPAVVTVAESITDPGQLVESISMSMSMAEAHSESSTSNAAAATIASLPLPQTQLTAGAGAATIPVDSSSSRLLEQHEGFPGIVINSSEDRLPSVQLEDIPDSIEERLSQLDGTPVAALPPIVNVELPTTHCVSQAQLLSQQQQLLPQQHQQQLQQSQPDILASPQHSAIRQAAGTLLTPQSTASSINFLKDGVAGAVLEDQDIEEVLKALKNLDGTHVNPDTICDFNFFNDEVCFLNNEEEAAAAAAAASGAIAAAPVELSPKASCSSSSNAAAVKTVRPWQESHAELEQQQHVLVRKMDFLVRRLRKFQARQMCHHASDEVAGILEWSARFSNKATPGAAPVRSAKLTEQEDTVLSIVSGRPGISFWEEQIKQPLPATQMSNVIHQIETSARKQQICHTIGGGSASLASSSSWYSNAAQPGKRSRKLQNNNNNMDANSNNSSDAIVMPRADEIVPNYDSYVTSELSHVAGLLHTEMREVQNAIDSDATESSSGGESADEMVNYNNSQQLSLSITKRAVWRYSRDRAAIALRWSWLCAQIYDLGIKIRQHNDVYNDLCRTKGDVLLESTTAPKNGYKESQISEMPDASGAASLDMDQQQIPAEALCSRTRPLVLSEFRKRKLFQTINMHTISKKAARPSNIKCGCQWPQVPCTLCTGRPDPTAPRELPETLMPQNRVALLDASYHPVLSFTDDVCQSLHLEAISRQPDWQYRVMRSQPKAIVKSVWKSEREAIASSGGVGNAGGAGGAAGAGGTRRPGDTVKRRYVRRKERNNNSNRNSSNNNNKNMNNNNNINKETSSTTTETAAVTTPMQQQQQSGTGGDGGVGGIVGLDSGNGTGTATTSSSTSTPTTTPLVANTVAKRHRQLAKTSGNANLNSTLFDPQQQQQQQSQQHQLNNSSLISSSGNSNGNKKSRKSASKQQQQQQQHSINNNNSQQTGSSDNNNRFPADNHWEQSNSRRNSVETHHVQQRSERTAERRSRLIYDIDNIVIPYSMAAQTRVEILPYKEIPTPKWRIVDIDNNKKSQQDEKLTNGCAKKPDEETKSTSNPKASTAATNEAAAASTPATPTASNAATATLPASTATPSAATTTSTKPAETVSKLNGLKQSNKNKTALETAKQPEQPISNGLANGNASKSEAAAEKQPKQVTTKLNGKIKSNNNQISVQPTSNCDGVNHSKDVVEPPKKRPKLQLKKKKKKQPKATKPTTAAATTDAAEPEEEPEEDISDEAYLVRHQQALIEERQRFESYLKFPWNSRPRANRRVDSRAESSGANTPDPASPAPTQLTGAIGGADNESIPSPLAQAMQQNPLDDGDVSTAGRTKGKRQERRRTTSSKLKEPDRRSATPDTREYPPLPMDPPAFEPLQFPLSKEVFQHLLAEMKIEPKPSRLTLPVMAAVSKRTKSKSVSSNGGEGNSTTTASNSGSRRSSKAKSTNASKLAQTPAALRLNGSKNTTKRVAKNGGKHDYDDAMDYGPEDDDEQQQQEDEDEDDDDVDELLLEEDDDYHYLAPPPEDEPLSTGVNNESSLYNASIDAYLGEQEGLEEELADDPFMDDDPNDPEWKRSIGVRHERMRKRV